MSATPALAAIADVPEAGDQVWVGDASGYGGTSIHAVFTETPTDPSDPGVPGYWAYCIEHDISARSRVPGEVGDFSGYLGDNLVIDPGVQAMVLWVLGHSYPALSLTEFGAAAGVPGISENDAIEATQYAIWRYTDVGYDAPWAWETPDSEAAYWYLVNGANASGGMTPSDFETTVSITGPATAQVAGTLVGPFTVNTNQTSVSVAADPSIAITDSSGIPIDASAVVDGHEFYLDLRSSGAAGSATVTVTAAGSSATGAVISVPTAAGDLTADEHAQTLILVAASTTSTTAEADVQWAAAAAGPTTLPETGGEWPTGLALLAALGVASGVALRKTARR